MGSANDTSECIALLLCPVHCPVHCTVHCTAQCVKDSAVQCPSLESTTITLPLHNRYKLT